MLVAEQFTPVASAIGGALIGLSATLLLFLNGRIAGISSIFAGSLPGFGGEGRGWRLAFLAGLVGGGLGYASYDPGAFAFSLDRSLGALAVAGLLVGFGTRLGGGCTSGHGVCGISRLSTRSIVATLIFIATGAIAVAVINRGLGGRL